MKLLLSLQLLLITSTSTLVLAFSSAFTKSIFQETKALQKLAPSKTAGIEIELPDFDEFFNRIQVVSPLARLAINGGGTGEGGGFAIVDDTGKRQGIHNTNTFILTHHFVIFPQNSASSLLLRVRPFYPFSPSR